MSMARLVFVVGLFLLVASSAAESTKLKFVPATTEQQQQQLNITNESINNTVDKTEDAASSTDSKEYVGYIAAAVAILFFGSNFVPVKKIETGDGLFFQWVLCSGIWVVGMVTNCIVGSPTFYPFAMLGGFLWATGNMCVVPIIKTIGLGLGMLLWGSFNMLSGWATGRFGLFNTGKDVIGDYTLNTIAIVMAMLSALCWLFVKPDANSLVDEHDDEDAGLLASEHDLESLDSSPADDQSWVDELTLMQKRVVGSSLSVISGLLYGFSFAPVLYVKHNYGDSQQDIDYVFAHFSGIYLTGTFYFVIYCCATKNRPKIYSSVVLPALVSGVMWGIAEVGWFIANEHLEVAISFPIITTGPAIVASLWGVVVFKEVSGRRNFLIMAFAYAVTIAAAVMAGVSKSA